MGDIQPVQPLPPGHRYYSDVFLRDRVAHHPPSSDAIIAGHALVRELFGDLLVTLNALLPEGDLKRSTLDDLIRNMQQANACIAVHQLVHGPLSPTDDCSRDRAAAFDQEVSR